MSTDHRPRTAGRGDVERLVEDARQVLDVLHQVVVLGAGRVMPTVSHSWKASVPIRCVGTWPVMHDQRDRVHQASVRPVTALVRAGTRGHQHARRPCRSSGRSLRRHGGRRPARGAPGRAAIFSCWKQRRRRSAAPRRPDSRRCARRPGPPERRDHHLGARHLHRRPRRRP